MKNAIIAILIILAIGTAAYFVVNRPEQPEQTGSTSAPMRAEENAIVTNDQKPGRTVTVPVAYLASSGYVVIREQTAAGTPGPVIGSSALLQAGENSRVEIRLNRPSVEGETLSAVLFFERDGSGTFSEAGDESVQSRLGGPIMSSFGISSTAEEGGAVIL